MTMQLNPFPYFTNFLAANLVGNVSYKLVDEKERMRIGWVGKVLVQLSSYAVLLADDQSKKIIGKFKTTMTGSPDEDDHFYNRKVIYKGKLPTKKGLTRFNRTVVYEEQPETFTSDTPVERKVRQPWFYKYKFPSWIFDHVIQDDELGVREIS